MLMNVRGKIVNSICNVVETAVFFYFFYFHIIQTCVTQVGPAPFPSNLEAIFSLNLFDQWHIENITVPLLNSNFHFFKIHLCDSCQVGPMSSSSSCFLAHVKAPHLLTSF